MKITLEISDDMLCGFFCGVKLEYDGLQMVSYQLSTDDLTDGNTIKLPREELRHAEE